MMMRMLFALMDSDGDGTISLQEFQAAHERIFKAMDANKGDYGSPSQGMDSAEGPELPFLRCAQRRLVRPPRASLISPSDKTANAIGKAKGIIGITCRAMEKAARVPVRRRQG